MEQRLNLKGVRHRTIPQADLLGEIAITLHGRVYRKNDG